MELRSPCPYLPIPDGTLNWHHLRQPDGNRGPAFYLCCLEYAQYLWLNHTPARSLLAIDRALFADVKGDEEQLKRWPLPYAGVVWIIRHATDRDFLGNPRIHFQHLADRINDPNRQIKKWRAWACWYLVRRNRPDLEGDPQHAVEPPPERLVADALQRHGIPNESDLWKSVLTQHV